MRAVGYPFLVLLRTLEQNRYIHMNLEEAYERYSHYILVEATHSCKLIASKILKSVQINRDHNLIRQNYFWDNACW